MTLPYLEPLEPRALSQPVIPEPPRRGEPGGPPCGVCEGAARRPSGATTSGRFTRRSAAACRARVDGVARARGLLQRPVAGGRHGFGSWRHGSSGAAVGRRLRARPPVPLGRRRSALPRLVHAAAARHARGRRHDAAAVGGRLAERRGRGVRLFAEKVAAVLESQRRWPDGPDDHPASPAGSASATPSSSGCRR